ncbi:hypothetical protein [Pseudomonas vranovensis]|nr:hypothetical protein [Pseudomonas vranovensis]
MFQQWSEMLQLYKRSRPNYWHAIRNNPLAPHLLPTWLVVLATILVVSASFSVQQHPLGPVTVMLSTSLCMWAMLLAREYFVAEQFKSLYQRHAIASQPLLQRDSYLRYAHFLQMLEQKAVSAAQAGEIAAFAKISENPPKSLNLTQNAMFVAIITFLATIAAEKAKLTELWAFGKGNLVILLTFAVLLVLWFGLMVVRDHLHYKERIIRYLEWASHDLPKP